MGLIQGLPARGNCLILSDECGTGHEEATKSIMASLEKANRSGLKVIKADVLRTTFGNCIANKAIRDWNDKLKREDVKALNNYLKYQWVDEWVLSIITFFRFLIYLSWNRIDTIISTQPLGTKAIVRAVRVVNWLRRCCCCRGQQIKYSMVLTELPNEKTLNFLPPVKRLNANDRKVFRLIALKPLLGRAKDEEEFWQKNAGLSKKKGEVIHDKPPLRHAFSLITPGQQISSLEVKYGSDPTELKLMGETCGDDLSTRAANGKLAFDIEPDEKVMMLMLGGQASIKATKQYVEHFIKRFKPSSTIHKKHYLFVFCGKHAAGQNSLLQQVHDIVAKARRNNQLSDQLCIVPLSFQDGEQIAPLMARSDLTITKSGGLTAMEVNAVVQRKIFLHASYDAITNPSESELIAKGMPMWEGGNADYLCKMRGATVINPQTFSRITDPFV